MRAPLDLLFEDEDLVALCKPSGLSVHAGPGEARDVLWLLAEHGVAARHTVHRLDRATSGVLLLAKHVEAAQQLGRAFAEREVRKVYWAFVRGELSATPTTVDAPIPKDEGAERVPARSLVRALSTLRVGDSPLREKRYSWAEVQPLTGRFHQVRRHLKHLGHPVLGDTTYGRSEHNRFMAEQAGVTRLALHALEISLPHPRTGHALTIEAPLPADLSRLASMFRNVRATFA